MIDAVIDEIVQIVAVAVESLSGNVAVLTELRYLSLNDFFLSKSYRESDNESSEYMTCLFVDVLYMIQMSLLCIFYFRSIEF